MAAAGSKGSKAVIVERQIVDHAGAFLETLPDKPKEQLSLRAAMEHLKQPIQSALARGYSYEELAKILGDQGIRISASTLKNYIPSGKRQPTKNKGRC